jgi:hypothetical protein
MSNNLRLKVVALDMRHKYNKQMQVSVCFPTPFVEEFVLKFDKTGAVSNENFEKLISENQKPERLEFIGLIKNYQHAELSRYLLEKAIAYRKDEQGNCKCSCEDLLMFSWFASKNKATTDFNTWCGFYGEMVFYTLGYQGTKDYITANKDRLIAEIDRFIDKTADYFIDSFDENYLYNDINSRAFWYLW